MVDLNQTMGDLVQNLTAQAWYVLRTGTGDGYMAYGGRDDSQLSGRPVGAADERRLGPDLACPVPFRVHSGALWHATCILRTVYSVLKDPLRQ